jgi:hypothetical protein
MVVIRRQLRRQVNRELSSCREHIALSAAVRSKAAIVLLRCMRERVSLRQAMQQAQRAIFAVTWLQLAVTVRRAINHHRPVSTQTL